MKKTYIISFFFLIASINFQAQTGWIQQKSGTTEDLKSVHFIDSNKGYAVGNNGTVLKTLDGGRKWIFDNFKDKNHLYSVFSIKNTCYVSGEAQLEKKDGQIFMSVGLIYKTTNLENKWNLKLKEYNSCILESIYFVDENTGYAVGLGGRILKTTNGGENWIVQDSLTDDEPYYKLKTVFFTDSITGYAIGGGKMGGMVLKTNNGGASWLKQNRDTIPYIESVYFTNSKMGYAVSGLSFTKNSSMLKTTDGGLTWSSLCYVKPSELVHNLKSIFFTDSLTGYAVGYVLTISPYKKIIKVDKVEPLILKTVDGGNTWKRQYCNLSGALISVFFTDKQIGYIVGGKGIILKTITGGD